MRKKSRLSLQLVVLVLREEDGRPPKKVDRLVNSGVCRSRTDGKLRPLFLRLLCNSACTPKGCGMSSSASSLLAMLRSGVAYIREKNSIKLTSACAVRIALLIPSMHLLLVRTPSRRAPLTTNAHCSADMMAYIGRARAARPHLLPRTAPGAYHQLAVSRDSLLEPSGMDYLWPCVMFAWLSYLWETYLQWRQV